MKVAIPREIHPGERRVAATPDTVKRLLKLGFEVSIGADAGAGSSMSDAAYEAAGARVVRSVAALWQEADLVLKVRPPEEDTALGKHEVDLLRPGATLVSFIWPANSPELLARFAARKVNVLAMDQVPRVTRAQKMDALSSMANTQPHGRWQGNGARKRYRHGLLRPCSEFQKAASRLSRPVDRLYRTDGLPAQH